MKRSVLFSDNNDRDEEVNMRPPGLVDAGGTGLILILLSLLLLDASSARLG